MRNGDLTHHRTSYNCLARSRSLIPLIAHFVVPHLNLTLLVRFGRKNISDLKMMETRISDTDAQDAFYLLTRCSSLPKPTYILRCSRFFFVSPQTEKVLLPLKVHARKSPNPFSGRITAKASHTSSHIRLTGHSYSL